MFAGKDEKAISPTTDIVVDGTTYSYKSAINAISEINNATSRYWITSIIAATPEWKEILPISQKLDDEYRKTVPNEAKIKSSGNELLTLLFNAPVTLLPGSEENLKRIICVGLGLYERAKFLDRTEGPIKFVNKLRAPLLKEFADGVLKLVNKVSEQRFKDELLAKKTTLELQAEQLQLLLDDINNHRVPKPAKTIENILKLDADACRRWEKLSTEFEWKKSIEGVTSRVTNYQLFSRTKGTIANEFKHAFEDDINQAMQLITALNTAVKNFPVDLFKIINDPKVKLKKLSPAAANQLMINVADLQNFFERHLYERPRDSVRIIIGKIEEFYEKVFEQPFSRQRVTIPELAPLHTGLAALHQQFVDMANTHAIAATAAFETVAAPSRRY